MFHFIQHFYYTSICSFGKKEKARHDRWIFPGVLGFFIFLVK